MVQIRHVPEAVHLKSRQLGSATSRAGQRAAVPLVRRQAKPAHQRPTGATQRKVASHSLPAYSLQQVEIIAQRPSMKEKIARREALPPIPKRWEAIAGHAPGAGDAAPPLRR